MSFEFSRPKGSCLKSLPLMNLYCRDLFLSYMHWWIILASVFIFAFILWLVNILKIKYSMVHM